jgi:subtilisin family serine protease
MYLRRVIGLLLIIFFVSFSQNQLGNKQIKNGVWREHSVEYVENEILVQFKNYTSKADIDKTLSKFKIKIIQDFNSNNWGVIELLSEENIFTVIDDIEKSQFVQFCEPNVIGSGCSDPNDTDFNKQWYLKNTGQPPAYGTPGADVDVSRAWDITQGSSNIIIGILDSGIPLLNDTLSHPELKDPNKIILGRNYSNSPDDSIMDVYAHGTHVAGIIAAKANNEYGIAGIANGCKVLIVKTMDNVGKLTLTGVCNSIEFAANYPEVKVINLSLIFTSPPSSLKNLISNYPNIIFICGAGNSAPLPVFWPAAFSDSLNNVVAVGATMADDFIATYSNQGPQINVTAPGAESGDVDVKQIYSTVPNYNGIGFGYKYGTSMSTAIVSAIAGLMLSKNQNLSPLQLRSTIEHSSVDKGDIGRDDLYGYGRVNAYYALLAVVGPQNFRRTSSYNSPVTIAWDPLQPTAPTNITQYYEISRNINNWGWSVIATTTNTSYTDNEFIRNHEGEDEVQYRIRSKTIDNLYSLYSNIINVNGTSYWQQKVSIPIKEIPQAYSLKQNFPNPFNPTTEITYDLPEPANVLVEVFNSIGQRVERFENNYTNGGSYTILWNAKHMSSGTYFLRMQAGRYSSFKKMVLMK